MKRLIKRFLPRGKTKRRLIGGVSRGSVMSVDLQWQLQRYLGLDEREIAAAVSRFKSSACTLVDVGANDGYYTVAFLGSAADCIIACEPSSICDELVANAAANGHQVSERFRVERRLIGTSSDGISLAEIVKQCPRPIFFKVDVDGCELDVLCSIESYPHLSDTFWIVETHSLELENDCLKWFGRRNFRTRIISPAFWRYIIGEQRPIEHNRWLIAEPPK